MIRSRPAGLPSHARLLALAWLLVYLPAYALAYGFANFLFLCNLSVILACLGILAGSPLLITSQAIGVLLVGAAWTLDFVCRLVTGAHLIGGTEYMWDPQWPLFTRLLSLYHVVLPPALAWAVSRVGHDRRALKLQSAIAVAGVLAGRALGREANINSAFVDPILGRSFEPPALHLAIVTGTLVLVVYPLSDLILRRLLPPRPPSPSP